MKQYGQQWMDGHITQMYQIIILNSGCLTLSCNVIYVAIRSCPKHSKFLKNLFKKFTYYYLIIKTWSFLSICNPKALKPIVKQWLWTLEVPKRHIEAIFYITIYISKHHFQLDFNKRILNKWFTQHVYLEYTIRGSHCRNNLIAIILTLKHKFLNQFDIQHCQYGVAPYPQISLFPKPS